MSLQTVLHDSDGRTIIEMGNGNIVVIRSEKSAAFYDNREVATEEGGIDFDSLTAVSYGDTTMNQALALAGTAHVASTTLGQVATHFGLSRPATTPSAQKPGTVEQNAKVGPGGTSVQAGGNVSGQDLKGSDFSRTYYRHGH